MSVPGECVAGKFVPVKGGKERERAKAMIERKEEEQRKTAKIEYRPANGHSLSVGGDIVIWLLQFSKMQASLF